MCFNKFSPMSLQRYWTFQLLVVAIPSIAFIVYGRHTLAQVQKISEIRDKIKNKQRQDVEKFKEKYLRNISNKDGTNANAKLYLGDDELEIPENANDQKIIKDDEMKRVYKTYYDGNIPFRKNLDSPSKLIILYFWSLIAKILLDIGFTIGQYYIYPYHFQMYTKYSCVNVFPCNSEVVSCWPIRPFEKTVFIWMWFLITISQIVLAVYEIGELGVLTIIDAYRKRGERDLTTMYKI